MCFEESLYWRMGSQVVTTCNRGIIKGNPFGEDQTMQMYGHFGGFPLMIAASFGLVIFLDLKICSMTLTGFTC